MEGRQAAAAVAAVLQRGQDRPAQGVSWGTRGAEGLGAVSGSAQGAQSEPLEQMDVFVGLCWCAACHTECVWE